MDPATLQTAAVEAPELWPMLLKSAAMLFIVLGILLGVLLVLKRLFYGQGSPAERGMIRVISIYHIAPKERLMLIDVMGERILIGATPQSIHRLARIPKEVDVEAGLKPGPPTGFARVFQNLLGKKPDSRPNP